MDRTKKPLYRKVNTKARGVHHFQGGDARHDRNTKDGLKKNMSVGKLRGLDYTPLFMFLLSKVGYDWSTVHSEAVSRLDKEEPIYYMVYIYEENMNSYFIYQNAYFSSLFVNNDGILCKVNPEFANEDLYPPCPCCTHTFNGKPLIRKHSYEYATNIFQK